MNAMAKFMIRPREQGSWRFRNRFVFLPMIVAVLCSTSDCKAQNSTVRESTIGLPNTESVADCYLGKIPDEIDFARSMVFSSRVRDRVCARWAQVAYDEDVKARGSAQELLKSLIEDLKKEFPKAPSWWLESLQSCTFDESGCAKFDFPKKRLQTFGENGSTLIEAKAEEWARRVSIQISDFSLGRSTGRYEAYVRKRPAPGIEQVFVCTFDESESQRFNLWSFSNSGRIQWMQSIDFYKSSELFTRECGASKDCRIEIVAHDVRDSDGLSVTELDVVIFAAWSNCVLLTRFSGEDGRAKFVFNTGLFPPLAK